MTKQDLQKELKEKVKEGVKPSDLKKLKRSKSDSDLVPTTQPSPTSIPLTTSKSQETFTDPKYPYTSLISQQETIEKLEKETKAKSETIKLLRDKIEKLEKDPPNSLLAEQLKEKQKEVESLREQKEELNQKLTQTTQELDQSLLARHESIKQFANIYDKWQEVKLTLLQTEDDATEDIISQDNEISKLRGQKTQMKLKIAELERDLQLVRRLAEMRKVPLPEYSNDIAPDWTRYLLWGSLVLTFYLWLLRWNRLEKE